MPKILHADIDIVKSKKISLLKNNANSIITKYYPEYRQSNIKMGLNYFVIQTDSKNGDGVNTTIHIDFSKLFAKPNTIKIKLNGNIVGNDDGQGNIIINGVQSGSVTYGNYDGETRTYTGGYVDIDFGNVLSTDDVIEVEYYVNLFEHMKYFIDSIRKGVENIENNILSATDLNTIDSIKITEEKILEETSSIIGQLVLIEIK